MQRQPEVTPVRNGQRTWELIPDLWEDEQFAGSNYKLLDMAREFSFTAQLGGMTVDHTSFVIRSITVSIMVGIDHLVLMHYEGILPTCLLRAPKGCVKSSCCNLITSELSKNNGKDQSSKY